MLVLCTKEWLANNKNYVFARQDDENVQSAPNYQPVALTHWAGLKNYRIDLGKIRAVQDPCKGSWRSSEINFTVTCYRDELKHLHPVKTILLYYH